MKPKQKKIIPSKNTVILVTWYTKQDDKGKVYQHGRKEVYSGLTCFIAYHPTYNRETVTHWITRRKQPFICPECTIEKISIIKPG